MTPDAEPAALAHPAAGRDDRITLRFLATPGDTAAGGRSVAAGSVMEWIDKAAYACAVGWAGGYCVTAYVGNMRHRRPIPPGSLIEVSARIVHTGTTSMHIVATVASADVSTREYTPATTCILVFVAKGADGRPAPVPAWSPVSAADAELQRLALDRIASRTEIKSLMLDEEYTDASAAPRTTLRFLVPPGVVNWGGKAHGGTVMRWMDEAAYAVTAAWVRDGAEASAAVGAYSGGIHFFTPISIGDLVEIDARIVYTSARSAHVVSRVLTGDPRTPHERRLATLCMSVFVVPSPDGEALPVPQWLPELAEDVRLHTHARRILELRERIEPIPAGLTLEA